MKGPTLLVGEGNFSFSVALTELVGMPAPNMVSTTFEGDSAWSPKTSRNALILRDRRVTVRGGVDATKLGTSFGDKKFQLVIFQFPNVGSRDPLYSRNPNHVLLRRFLKSAAAHLSPEGKVAVKVVNSSHYDGAFDMDGAAEYANYVAPAAYPFLLADYPGYSHVKTKDDGAGAISDEDELVTCVFRPKKIGRSR